MVERVQVRLVGQAERAGVGLAVLYAVIVPFALLAFDTDLVAVYGVLAVVIASPLAFSGRFDFQITCLAVAAVLMVLSILLAVAGMFVYLPVAFALCLAASPLVNRYPTPSLLVTALFLTTTPLAFTAWIK